MSQGEGAGAGVDSAPAAGAVAPTRADGERVKASPLARRIARERGVELAQISAQVPRDE